MSSGAFELLASFTTPIEIGTDPMSMLWMFPLLAAVAIIYKAVKMRVMFMGKYFREVFILFVSISIFIVLIGIALHILVYFLTG
jgi:hypothetical protein